MLRKTNCSFKNKSHLIRNVAFKNVKNQRLFNSNRPLNTSTSQQGLRGYVSKEEILGLPSTPLLSPSYPRGPYIFYDREFFIIKYETDPDALAQIVPEPLKPRPPGNVALYEWISMPDSTGFGDYTESGIVVPCVHEHTGEHVNYTAQMYLDCEPPIAAGREIWGFPKKFAQPTFTVKRDTVRGTLNYAGQEVAQGTMNYKFEEIPRDEAVTALSGTQVNLKVIPGVDWKPRISRLVSYNLSNIHLKGAWRSPARLALEPHINAPVADLPVHRVLGGNHFLADITLPYGNIMHDYLKENSKENENENENKKDSHSDITIHSKTENHRFTQSQVLNTVSMPAVAPSYLSGPVSLSDRNYFIIEYKTDMEALRKIVPDQLLVNAEARVFAQWVSSTGTGLGDYHKFDLMVPVQSDTTGQQYNYGLISLVDSSAPITAGREVYGQPQKFGLPSLDVCRDTINGMVSYSDHSHVAQGSMNYKHFMMPQEAAAAMLSTPEINLKFVPDVNGRPEIAQLVSLEHEDIKVMHAWQGPARLSVTPHVNAPIADLPVREVLNGYNIICDLKLPSGEVVHDYLK